MGRSIVLFASAVAFALAAIGVGILVLRRPAASVAKAPVVVGATVVAVREEVTEVAPKVQKYDPENTEAVKRMRAGDYDGAEYYAKKMTNDPHTAAGVLGHVYLQRHLYRESIDQFTRYIETAETDAGRADGHIRRGNARLSLGVLKKIDALTNHSLVLVAEATALFTEAEFDSRMARQLNPSRSKDAEQISALIKQALAAN